MLFRSNRPPDPKNARNKNVLVVGGSGSGKTRYFIKPNLLQCTSKSHPVSFVVTDPKGGLIQECGLALLKNGYKIRTMNTINFHKSMRYNPFAYIHEEKDILKLVTTLMTNTKGEGQEGDLHLRDEDDYVELVEKGGFDVIYADHCMERMTPKFAGIFVDTVHFAVSGRLA